MINRTKCGVEVMNEDTCMKNRTNCDVEVMNEDICTKNRTNGLKTRPGVLS